MDAVSTGFKWFYSNGSGYSELFDHYYQLGEVDSLRCGYGWWTGKVWRNKRMNSIISCGSAIQRLTENGKQDEAISETELLSKDAERITAVTQACGEMCTDIIIGYSVITPSNSVLNIITMLLRFWGSQILFKDAYVVCLNIADLPWQEYENVHSYLDRLEKIATEIKTSGKRVACSFICVFTVRVIATHGR